MRLKDIFVTSLKPYQSQLSDWSKNDLEMLFMGFGNLRIVTPARIEFEQSFYKNAVDICLALDELGFGEMEFLERDLYYVIHAQPAIIRSDLAQCIEAEGHEILPIEAEGKLEKFEWDGCCIDFT
jgi:hypothetical protein|tara:strand:+ start:2334 stop:2708 length:375 start_codon:yes stop_codon:yes gene_type:complete